MKKYIILALLSIASFQSTFSADIICVNQAIEKSSIQQDIVTTQVSEDTAAIDQKNDSISSEKSFLSRHKVKLIGAATACALIASYCYAYKNKAVGQAINAFLPKSRNQKGFKALLFKYLLGLTPQDLMKK